MDHQALTDPAAWVAKLTADNAEATQGLKDYLRGRVTEAPAQWAPVLRLVIDIRQASEADALTVEWVQARWADVDDDRVVQLAALAHAVTVTTWTPATILWDTAHAWGTGQASTVIEALHIASDAPDDYADMVEAEIRHCRRGDMVALAVIGAMGLAAIDFPTEELASLFNLATAILVDS